MINKLFFKGDKFDCMEFLYIYLFFEEIFSVYIVVALEVN